MTHGSVKSPYGTHFIDTHSHDEPKSHTARVFDNETVWSHATIHFLMPHYWLYNPYSTIMLIINQRTDPSNHALDPDGGFKSKKSYSLLYQIIYQNICFLTLFHRTIYTILCSRWPYGTTKYLKKLWQFQSTAMGYSLAGFIDGLILHICLCVVSGDLWSGGLFYQHRLTLIPAWITSYIYNQTWVRISFSFKTSKVAPLKFVNG